MKIATWNVERYQRKYKQSVIVNECLRIDADILILTEADTRIELPAYQSVSMTEHACSIMVPGNNTPLIYSPTERRVMLFSKYPIVEAIETYDSRISLAAELDTPCGPLVIYGTIMGCLGWKGNFHQEVSNTLADIEALVTTGKSVCLIGDYNCSFSDNYFCNAFAKEKILASFDSTGISLLTAGQHDCIDHIAISKYFVNGNPVTVQEWNLDCKLSDHKGIAVVFG